MFFVVDKSTETCQCSFFIFRLVACLGTFNQDFFGNACIRVLPDIAQAYSWFYLIDILSAGTAASESIPFDFAFINDYVKFFRFGKYGYRSCRSMYTSLGFCGGNTLYAVYARFIFQDSVNIVTCDAANYFLESACCSFVRIGDFHLPAFCFAEFGIHTEEVAGKDGRLVTTCTATDFKNRIFAVLRVGGNKHQFDFFFQYGKAFLAVVHFFFSHFTHFGIRLTGKYTLGLLDVT